MTRNSDCCGRANCHRRRVIDRRAARQRPQATGHQDQGVTLTPQCLRRSTLGGSLRAAPRRPVSRNNSPRPIIKDVLPSYPTEKFIFLLNHRFDFFDPYTPLPLTCAVTAANKNSKCPFYPSYKWAPCVIFFLLSSCTTGYSVAPLVTTTPGRR